MNIFKRLFGKKEKVEEKVEEKQEYKIPTFTRENMYWTKISNGHTDYRLPIVNNDHDSTLDYFHINV